MKTKIIISILGIILFLGLAIGGGIAIKNTLNMNINISKTAIDNIKAENPTWVLTKCGEGVGIIEVYLDSKTTKTYKFPLIGIRCNDTTKMKSLIGNVITGRLEDEYAPKEIPKPIDYTGEYGGSLGIAEAKPIDGGGIRA